MRGNAVIKINDGIDFERFADVHLSHSAQYSQATLTRGETNREEIMLLEGALIDIFDDAERTIEIRGFRFDGEGHYDLCELTFTPCAS